MKLFNLFVSLILFSGLTGFAQLSGEAHYITKIDGDKLRPGGPPPGRMGNAEPLIFNFESVLLFTPSMASYRYLPPATDIAVGDSREDRRKQFMMKRLAPENNITFTDIEQQQVVEQKEFMDKIFLIEDSIRSTQWKFSGETKVVSGMNCMKAEYIPDTINRVDIKSAVVWFTPEVPISAGPAGFGGLPGLILNMNINDGEREIFLSKIIIREIEENEIELPKKGKKVTREEYAAIVIKKREEQRKMYEDRGSRGGPPH